MWIICIEKFFLLVICFFDVLFNCKLSWVVNFSLLLKCNFVLKIDESVLIVFLFEVFLCFLKILNFKFVLELFWILKLYI